MHVTACLKCPRLRQALNLTDTFPDFPGGEDILMLLPQQTEAFTYFRMNG